MCAIYIESRSPMLFQSQRWRRWQWRWWHQWQWWWRWVAETGRRWAWGVAACVSTFPFLLCLVRADCDHDHDHDDDCNINEHEGQLGAGQWATRHVVQIIELAVSFCSQVPWHRTCVPSRLFDECIHMQWQRSDHQSSMVRVSCAHSGGWIQLVGAGRWQVWGADGEMARLGWQDGGQTMRGGANSDKQVDNHEEGPGTTSIMKLALKL